MESPVTPDFYNELKRKLARGWNTWNTRSVLSHVLLPEGIAVNLGIKEYRDRSYLKESLIGRRGDKAEVVVPAARSYDGRYTDVSVRWKDVAIRVQSAAEGDDLLLKEWREHGRVCENYCADTGQGGELRNSDAFYHWGGLLGLIAFLERDFLPNFLALELGSGNERTGSAGE